MRHTGIYHVNINCTDLERSVAFYAALGFVEALDFGEVTGPGLEKLLRLPGARGRAKLLRHATNPRSCHIDLIEWQGAAARGRPYDRLDHPGIARLCFFTTDIQADYRAVLDLGAEILSEPVEETFADGTKIAAFCFLDPDGTVLELVQSRRDRA